MTKFLIGVLAVFGVLYAVHVLFQHGVQYPTLPQLWTRIRHGANRLHYVIGVIATAIVCLYLLRLGIYLIRSW